MRKIFNFLNQRQNENLQSFDTKTRFFLLFLILLGNLLTFIGLSILILCSLKFLNFEIFSYGLSSGERIVGSVVISGCLFSAFGYGVCEINPK